MLLFSSSQQGLWRTAETQSGLTSKFSQEPKHTCPLVITPKFPDSWLASLQDCRPHFREELSWDSLGRTSVKIHHRQLRIREGEQVILWSVLLPNSQVWEGHKCLERLTQKALGLEKRTRLDTPSPSTHTPPFLFYQSTLPCFLPSKFSILVNGTAFTNRFRPEA